MLTCNVLDDGESVDQDPSTAEHGDLMTQADQPTDAPAGGQ
jgi:hypothetical protein